MSEENLETVRRLVRAFGERERGAATEPFDPEVVWDVSRIAVDDLRGVYHGHDGAADFWRRWLGAWKAVEPGEFEVFDGGDQVLGWFANQRNVGKQSGIEIHNPEFGLLYAFQAGKIVRVTLYDDKTEALEAAGLSE